MSADNIELIIDDREKAIFPYIKSEIKKINYVIGRINVGDYAIVNHSSGQILAVIERKTLDDFAASFKDGRYENKDKMIKLREKTGCKLLFIIEKNIRSRIVTETPDELRGKINPDPNKMFGRTTYRQIESSIFHMMIRDNIQFLYTANGIETAGLLERWVLSMQSLSAKDDLEHIHSGKMEILGETDGSADNSNDNSNDNLNQHDPVQPENVESDQLNQINLLNQKQEISTMSIVREMWAQIRGITVLNADLFICKFSVLDYIRGNINSDDLSAIRYSNGRKLSKKLLENVKKSDKNIIVRMLACVPQVSSGTAEIVYKCAISDKNGFDPAKLADLRYGSRNGGKGTRFGEKKANLLIECLNFTSG